MNAAAARIVDALPKLLDVAQDAPLAPEERREVLDAIATLRRELTADLPEWFTYKQAGEFLGCHWKTVWRKGRAGLIKVDYRDPFTPRIHRDELLRYAHGRPSNP